MTEWFRVSDGRTLAYRREGSGPVLVCHPGGPGYSSLYFGDLAGLGEHFTLVMLNPRGTDGSDRPSEARAYRLDDYVADLEELRIHLGITSMNLLGHSHGGVVAVAYAATYPKEVGKLVLASTLVRFAQEQLAGMTKSMAEKVGEPWYEDAREALERSRRAASRRIESWASSRSGNSPSTSPTTAQAKLPTSRLCAPIFRTRMRSGSSTKRSCPALISGPSSPSSTRRRS